LTPVTLLSTSIVSISHRRLLWAFTTVSVTVIDKVGLDIKNTNRELYVLTVCKI